jgi:hypothetical protein
MSTIVQQAVQWLEKMGIGVEYNAELQEFKFEYKDAFVIINTEYIHRSTSKTNTK